MAHSEVVLAVEAADGHRFELIHVPAEGEHQARSLLCLPGMGLTARQYIPFAKSLAAQGISVWIHEWRGLGSSSWRAGRDCDWGYQQLIEVDLAAALAALPDQPLVLAGHSLGSQLAAMLAGHHPERCAGLVVIAGGSPWLHAFNWRMRNLLRLLFYGMPALVAVVGYFPGKTLGFAGREAGTVMKDWARSGLTGHYRLPGMVIDNEQAMDQVHCPVLSVRMADDSFVTPASLEWLTQKLGSPSHQREVLDGQALGLQAGQAADHYIWMKEPAAVSALIKTWWPTSGMAAGSNSNSP